MQVNIFTLCDSAWEYDGKLVIVGTFNRISAEKFPVIHREFAIVAGITFGKEESGKHSIELSINKRDGDVVLMPTRKFDADTTNSREDSATVNVIIRGINTQIPEHGVYVINLKVDGKAVESDLTVVENK